ncbi:hypothetical protein [Streptomyces sp. SAS_260]|uniref:hypothetical protein n=1 Tax=Streptomyces sp. SAS_260 TaxID=3412751 RepID=UPI00403C1AAC
MPDSTEPAGSSRTARHRRLVPLGALTAVVLVSGGYAVTTAHHDNATPAADSKAATPAPEVTRPYGEISHVKPDQDPNDLVKLRSCTGPTPQGDPTGDCPIQDWLKPGTPVTMRCWTDLGVTPTGYPKSHHRWFYVTENDGAPHPGWAGWIYSALIPVPEQTRTPLCDPALLARFPSVPDTPTPTPTAPPTPKATTPPPLSPVPSPPPTPTPAPPSTPPPPTPTPAAPQTVTEQSGTHGSPTFSDPYHASGPGPRIESMTQVEVFCRVYAPSIESAKPDGWWYKIGGDWQGQYYAVANTFWNGDTPGQKPYTHNTDWNVPECR